MQHYPHWHLNDSSALNEKSPGLSVCNFSCEMYKRTGFLPPLPTNIEDQKTRTSEAFRSITVKCWGVSWMNFLFVLMFLVELALSICKIGSKILKSCGICEFSFNCTFKTRSLPRRLCGVGQDSEHHRTPRCSPQNMEMWTNANQFFVCMVSGEMIASDEM